MNVRRFVKSSSVQRIENRQTCHGSERRSRQMKPCNGITWVINQCEQRKNKFDGRRISQRIAPLSAGDNSIPTLQLSDETLCSAVGSNQDAKSRPRIGMCKRRCPSSGTLHDTVGGILFFVTARRSSQTNPSGKQLFAAVGPVWNELVRPLCCDLWMIDQRHT